MDDTCTFSAIVEVEFPDHMGEPYWVQNRLPCQKKAGHDGLHDYHVEWSDPV